jgi:hypothetical protein
MCNFIIIRHDDYHGDAISFSIMDEDGHECDRVVSEAEALWAVVYFEALAEDEARAPAFSDQSGDRTVKLMSK